MSAIAELLHPLKRQLIIVRRMPDGFGVEISAIPRLVMWPLPIERGATPMFDCYREVLGFGAQLALERQATLAYAPGDLVSDGVA